MLAWGLNVHHSSDRGEDAEPEHALNALLGTAYGRTLIFKVALAILLLVSGAANHFLHIPRLDRGEPEAAPRLMQTVRRELAVGGLLLGITGLLVSLPMPHEVEPNTAIQVSLDPALTRTQNMPESGTSP